MYSGYTLSYQLTEQHVPKVYNTVCTLDTHCHTNWQSNMYPRSTIQCVLWIHIVIPTDKATCIQGLQYSVYSGYTLTYQLTEQHVPKVYNTVCTLDTHCRTNWQSNMLKTYNTVCTLSLDTYCHTNWQSNMYLRYSYISIPDKTHYLPTVLWTSGA